MGRFDTNKGGIFMKLEGKKRGEIYDVFYFCGFF
jgi:hypothetical protein